MNKPQPTLFVVILCLASSFLISIPGQSKPLNEYTDLINAVRSSQVQVNPLPQGGLGKANLKCLFKNLTKRILYIRIPPGLHFKSHDEGAQDLLTAKAYLLALAPNSQKSVDMQGFCMEARNYSPKSGEGYSLKGYASPALKMLSDSLNLYQPIAEDYGQMFVWALSDKKPLYTVEVAKPFVRPAKNIMRLVADVAGLPTAPVHAYVLPKQTKDTPRPKPTVKTFSKRVNLAFHNPKAQVVNLKVYDGTGQEVWSIFENKSLEAGLRLYTFAINETVLVTENPVYHYKLTNTQGELLAHKIVNSSTSEHAIKPTEFKFTFKAMLTKPIAEAKTAVYLEDSTLVEEFENLKSLKAGRYEFTYELHHVFPVNTKFIAKLVGPDNTVYQNQLIIAQPK